MPKAKKQQEFTTAKFTGICRWAKVHEARGNQFDDTPIWSIDLLVPNETVEEKLRELEINIKTYKNTGEKYFVVKQKAFKKDGKPNKAPEVVDTMGNEVTDPIGNGSKVMVEFSATKWDISRFASLYLNKVTVIDLEEYKGGSTKTIDLTEDLTDTPF